MTKQALIIFARNPKAGKVKTRLAATIGAEAALSVYKELVLCTVAATKLVPVDKFVFYSDYISNEDAWISNNYNKEIQRGNDLGEKMANAFTCIFQKGYNKVVIIGTDCPALNDSIIGEAFAKLAGVDVVIGPAFDGGYYLLGMKHANDQLFKDMEWSTSTVFPKTFNRCKQQGLSISLLETLHDVDEENDLHLLSGHK